MGGGGYLKWSNPWRGWGIPWSGQDGGGVPEVGFPLAEMGYHPQYRTADGVLDTPRSVFLFRSRRRTLLCFLTVLEKEMTEISR